jgi:hypothetical protein
MPCVTQPRASSGTGPSGVFIRVPNAWRRELITLAILGAVLVGATLSRLRSQGATTVVIIELVVVGGLVVILGGLAVLKGRRAGIEIRPDGITVRRCWLPNRELSRDEVRGHVKVRTSAVSSQLGSTVLWMTSIELLPTSGHKVRTLGVAILEGNLRRAPGRARASLDAASHELSGLGIRCNFDHHTSLWKRLRNRNGKSSPIATPVAHHHIPRD